MIVSIFSAAPLPATITGDWPSAHSMDSSWFAVDDDGAIGFFETGEAGAMPERHAAGYETLEALEERLLRLPAHTYAIVVPGLQLPQRQGTHVRQPDQTAHHPYFNRAICLVPRDSNPADLRYLTFPTCGVPEDQQAFLLTERRDFDELHRRGLCLGCVRADWRIGDAIERFNRPGAQERNSGILALAEHGVFGYDHLCENWTAGPYGQQVRPTQPLHVDTLPPDLRDALKRLHITGTCFRTDVHLNPYDLGLKCDAYSQHYRPTEHGELVPDELAGEYNSLRQLYPTLGFHNRLETALRAGLITAENYECYLSVNREDD